MLRNHHLRTLMRRGLAMVETDDFRVLMMMYDLGTMTIYDILGMKVSIKIVEIVLDSRRRPQRAHLYEVWCLFARAWHQRTRGRARGPWWQQVGASTMTLVQLHLVKFRHAREWSKDIKKGSDGTDLMLPGQMSKRPSGGKWRPAGESLSLWVCLQSPKPALLIVHTWESMLTVWNCYLSNCYGQRYIENMRYIHFLYCIEKCFSYIAQKRHHNMYINLMTSDYL